MRFDIETQASPEQVHQALTDFTKERLHIWNRTLDPKTYELREHGPNWAVARESTPGRRSGFVARYDWSDPSVVRWTVVESSYGGSGQGFVRIVPRDGGGSRLHAEWVNTESRRQKLMLLLLHLVPDRMVDGALIRDPFTADLDAQTHAVFPNSRRGKASYYVRVGGPTDPTFGSHLSHLAGRADKGVGQYWLTEVSEHRGRMGLVDVRLRQS